MSGCRSRFPPRALNSDETCWPLLLSNTGCTQDMMCWLSHVDWSDCCSRPAVKPTVWLSNVDCSLLLLDSRSCSSTRCLLDVANPLVTRFHHMNLVRWSCSSIASSTWLSTSFSVCSSTVSFSNFCCFSSANWSHQHHFLFDTTLQLGVLLLLRCDDDAQLYVWYLQEQLPKLGLSDKIENSSILDTKE